MVSVIVPVYNCGEYLSRCVESVLAQTYADFELILVDDGSFDGSSELCDLWAESDSRIKVIHQENAGVSAARNTGLDAAKGDWIGFLDADDRFAPKALELALAASGDCDMVMFDAVSVWDAGQAADSIPLLADSRVLEKQDFTPALLAQMAGAVWRCLYKKELVEGIRFPVGIKLSEDRLFNLAAMGKADRISYLKKGLYFHYMIEGSACFRYHGDKFEKNLQAMKIAEEYIEKYWGGDYLPVYVKGFILGGALDGIYEIASKAYPGKHRLAAIREITSHPAMEDAFGLCPPEGLREKLLKAKANLPLLAVGWLWNLKNRR